MQFALQDIRRWGYKKIFQSFVPTDRLRGDFFDDIKRINLEFYDVKCSAFSFPRKWNDVKSNVNHFYRGMKTFVYSCEPLIDNIKVDSVCQRKFRNQWQSLWKNVSKDLDLTDKEELLLMDCGIKLAFAEDYYSIPDYAITFYNAILNWSVFILSECNFTSAEMTPLQLVELMVISDDDSFVEMVQRNFA